MTAADPTPTETAPRVRALYSIAALVLAASLLYYSLRGIDWLRVWDILRGARPLAICLAWATITSAVFLRSIRWRVLLSAGKPVSVPLAFWATAAGYLGNNLLPARAGELVRTVMISRRSGMSNAFVLATALSERVSDAIALIAISAAVLLAMPNPPGWLAVAARPFAIAGLCGAAAIALLPAFEALYFRILKRVPVPPPLRSKLENALGHAIQGIRSFHDRRRLARFVALTAVIWTMDAANAAICARALGFHMTLPVAFLLIAGLGLGSALPSTPGYVGIYQFVAVSILTPFGFRRSDAIADILLMQALIYSVILFWGLIGLAKGRRGEVLTTRSETLPSASQPVQDSGKGRPL
ncbi:MAG: lysylphosphatidylglycerol synthase transmembrane domain-containing protein [Bryobacteraceae bacterium]